MLGINLGIELFGVALIVLFPLLVAAAGYAVARANLGDDRAKSDRSSRRGYAQYGQSGSGGGSSEKHGHARYD